MSDTTKLSLHRAALWTLGLLALASMLLPIGCSAYTKIDPAANSATRTIKTINPDGTVIEDSTNITSKGAGGQASGDKADLNVNSKAGATDLPLPGKTGGGAGPSTGDSEAFAEITAVASLWWVRLISGLLALLCGYIAWAKFSLGNVPGAVKAGIAAAGLFAGVFWPVAMLIGLGVAFLALVASALYGIKTSTGTSALQTMLDNAAVKGNAVLTQTLAEIRSRSDADYDAALAYVTKNHGAVLVPPTTT